MIDIDKLDVTKHDSFKYLEELGYTKETFKGTELELFIKAMIKGIDKFVQEETKRLMKEHSLSYGEALGIVLCAIKKQMMVGKIK